MNSESQKEMLKMIQNHSEKTAQAYSSYIKKSKQSNNFGPGNKKPNFPTLNGRTPHGRCDGRVRTIVRIRFW